MRSPVGRSPLWLVLWAGAGILVILALGWFVWSRGVEATRRAAADLDIGRPAIQPPGLPQGPDLPDLPVPRPQ